MWEGKKCWKWEAAVQVKVQRMWRRGVNVRWLPTLSHLWNWWTYERIARVITWYWHHSNDAQWGWNVTKVPGSAGSKAVLDKDLTKIWVRLCQECEPRSRFCCSPLAVFACRCFYLWSNKKLTSCSHSSFYLALAFFLFFSPLSLSFLDFSKRSSLFCFFPSHSMFRSVYSFFLFLFHLLSFSDFCMVENDNLHFCFLFSVTVIVQQQVELFPSPSSPPS